MRPPVRFSLPGVRETIGVCAMQARVSSESPAQPVAGPAFVPPDYFRRLEKREIFDGDRPLEVDLGCGDGTFLLEMARQFPERDFLGVERLLGRVRKVCKRAMKAGLHNVKVLRLESRYTVEWLLPEASVDRMHLLCPDPWPKARHHRNRLMQKHFLDAAWHALKPGGEFLFKTDHVEYHAWAVERVHAFGRFRIADWPDDAFFYPKTDFEMQWESEGKTINRLRCIKDLMESGFASR